MEQQKKPNTVDGILDVITSMKNTVEKTIKRNNNNLSKYLADFFSKKYLYKIYGSYHTEISSRDKMVPKITPSIPICLTNKIEKTILTDAEKHERYLPCTNKPVVSLNVLIAD